MVLILIKLCLSGRFASIFRFSSAVGITVEDGRFCPVAVTVAVRIHILIIGNAR
jgi:hypothetical protein